MKRTLVRYRTKPEHAQENERLIEKVFQELRARSPESRTTPKPERPGGVEMATMVSRICSFSSSVRRPTAASHVR